MKKASGWKKSSRCESSMCVETRRLADGTVLVRNSVKPDAQVAVGPQGWQTFIDAVKAGEYDGPAS